MKSFFTLGNGISLHHKQGIDLLQTYHILFTLIASEPWGRGVESLSESFLWGSLEWFLHLTYKESYLTCSPNKMFLAWCFLKFWMATRGWCIDSVLLWSRLSFSAAVDCRWKCRVIQKSRLEGEWIVQEGKENLVVTHMSRNWFVSPILSDFELTWDPKIKVSMKKRGSELVHEEMYLKRMPLFRIH